MEGIGQNWNPMAKQKCAEWEIPRWCSFILRSLGPQAGLSEEPGESMRTPVWGLQQWRWLVSLCYQSDDVEGRFYTASPFRRDGNPAFQRESWEIRTKNRDNWRFLTKRIKGLRGKRSKRLKPKTLSTSWWTKFCTKPVSFLSPIAKFSIILIFNDSLIMIVFLYDLSSCYDY